ncbi:hypothetical protein KSS87_004946 [Heliosperma pusillum]|nr:hypothetical protein KSS87_004946 [Heliosperma pusillum]
MSINICTLTSTTSFLTNSTPPFFSKNHQSSFNSSSSSSPPSLSIFNSFTNTNTKIITILRRRNHLKPMSSSFELYNDDFKPFQLNDLHDFQKIASSEGYISICGFGSLLSEKSAMSTFPNLINFRVARLKGFRRVFAHVAPIFFERGIAKPETKEISSLSVEPCKEEELIVTVFEIRESEVPSFMDRELEFRFLAVMPETLEGKAFTNPAVLCSRYSDEEFFNIRCKGSKEIYYQHYGRYNIDNIWRDDILPCRLYLRHCVLAAKNLGEVAYNNFLDHTYLGNRETTIRQYLMTTGSGVMEEEPPESLKTRYGG